MASLKLEDFIDIGSGGPITAISYQFALDKEFTQIIDESIHDTVNLDIWHSPLPRMDGDGFYNDLPELYGRIKIHSGEHESEWFVCAVGSQTDYPIDITDTTNETVTPTTTVKLEWYKG